MNLKVIATGSKGNAYLLENENEALLIECGVNIMDIKKALGFDLSKVVGCILTHEHNDHARSVRDILKCGIKVYSNKGTFDSLCIDSGWRHLASPLHGIDDFKIGNFKIKSFDVRHDAAEPCGFLINHPETGNVLFLTDTFYCPYTFRGLNNIIVEANYSEKIIKKKLIDKEFLKDRIIQSHMSLEYCLDFLSSNDLTKVNNIVLIHLSDGNSNAAQFEQAVQKQTGKSVTVADKGLIMELNKNPF